MTAAPLLLMVAALITSMIIKPVHADNAHLVGHLAESRAKMIQDPTFQLPSLSERTTALPETVEEELTSSTLQVVVVEPAHPGGFLMVYFAKICQELPQVALQVALMIVAPQNLVGVEQITLMWQPALVGSVRLGKNSAELLVVMFLSLPREQFFVHKDSTILSIKPVHPTNKLIVHPSVQS